LEEEQVLPEILRLGAFPIALACGSASVADVSQLVNGISQITSEGLPGPVYPRSEDWWPVVAGDDDATYPSLFVAAREYGAGRVVICGHPRIIQTVALDNDAFRLNVVDWLDGAGSKQVGYTTGHSEWINAGALSHLGNQLAAIGGSLTPIPAPITAASLSKVDLLIAGDAWSDFSSSEIETVREWVEQQGGGLLLLGLGWSWEPYHPDTTLEDYPMMKLAQPYEVRWLRNVIEDPTNQHNGSAVFHVFYPDIEISTIYDAISEIVAAHAQHDRNLPVAVETLPELRLRFVRAHQTLAIPSYEFPLSHGERTEVFDAYSWFAQLWPDYYARYFAFDHLTLPTSARLRERAWRSWRDALQLTPEIQSQIAGLGQLSGTRLGIFNSLGVVLLDNSLLNQEQLDVIHAYGSLIPQLLHNLRAISVNDFLGSPALPIPLNGMSGAVNVFGIAVGGSSGNSFPPDVPPGVVDTYSIVVAHEINHIVDSYTIGGSPALTARRAALIAAAGDDPLNYLRSMLPPGFFVQNPQEFFASIANQWFTDSAKTIALGLVRFDAGRHDPINQALFFADVYSMGNSITYLYTTDTLGHITRHTAAITRNPRGSINSIQIDLDKYLFELDDLGNVIGYSIVPSADINGDGQVDVDDLIAVILAWGPCPAPLSSCPADADQSSAVDVDDLILVILNWG
jgi:hypothetical protein